MISFFLHCDPPTASHHAKRIIKLKRGFALADKPELKAARKLLETLMQPHRVPSPMTGAVALTLEYVFPWRAGDSQRTRAAGRVPKFTRPDCSNLAKTTEDRLVAMGFLEDDGQVTQLIVRKWFGTEPGIRVFIEPFIHSTLPIERMSV